MDTCVFDTLFIIKAFLQLMSPDVLRIDVSSLLWSMQCMYGHRQNSWVTWNFQSVHCMSVLIISHQWFLHCADVLTCTEISLVDHLLCFCLLSVLCVLSPFHHNHVSNNYNAVKTLGNTGLHRTDHIAWVTPPETLILPPLSGCCWEEACR